MYGILGNKLAIVVPIGDVVELAAFWDKLKELDLFERSSFDVTRMAYMVYLKSVNTDNYESLYSLVNARGYRLVRCS